MICPVVGGVIAGSGGIVVSGSQITDAVLSKKRRSSGENILKKYKSRVEILMNECVEIGKWLKKFGDIDINPHGLVSGQSLHLTRQLIMGN